MKSSENNLINLQYDFFKNGWCWLNPDSINITKKIRKDLKKISTKDMIKNKKNAGSLSLDQNSIKNYKVFQELENNKLMYETVSNITGRNITLSCFMHMLSIGKTKELIWHRDSYIRKNKFIGPIPSVIKLIIFNTKVSKKDGPFELISGSHSLDFSNKVFDKLLPLFLFTKKVSFRCQYGSCVLFDGRLLHKRASSNKNGFRSATIISFNSTFN